MKRDGVKGLPGFGVDTRTPWNDVDKHIENERAWNEAKREHAPVAETRDEHERRTAK